MAKLRVVYDCNIFWRAAFSQHSSGTACVELIRDGTIQHFMSRETLFELRDVLTRPETLLKFSAINPVLIDQFVSDIVKVSVVVRSVPRSFNFPRDPKDEPYIELAGLVNADYLVTYDKDLLDLMTGVDSESKQFRQKFRDLRIMKPDEFLRMVSTGGLAGTERE